MNSLFLGDFNGDQRDDVLCHDNTNGAIAIAFADVPGNISSTPMLVITLHFYNVLRLVRK